MAAEIGRGVYRIHSLLSRLPSSRTLRNTTSHGKYPGEEIEDQNLERLRKEKSCNETLQRKNLGGGVKSIHSCELEGNHNRREI